MKYLFAILFVAISFVNYGQDGLLSLEQLKATTLKIGEGLDKKACEKTWKKEMGEWFKKTELIEDLDDLSDQLRALNGFIKKDAYNDYYNVSGGTSIKLAAEDLILFYKSINPDLLNVDIPSEIKMLQAGVDAQTAIDKQKEMEARIKALTAAFEKTYPGILNDAKPGSFGTLRQELKDVPGSADKQTLLTIDNEPIFISLDEDIYTAYSVLTLDSDKNNALELYTELCGIINKNLPEGFGESASYQPKFVSGHAKAYEFVSERFADSAKQPTILIGVVHDKNKNFAVLIEVTEPVFKR